MQELMLKEAVLNPEQNRRVCSTIQPILIQRRKNSTTTQQCSTQVNMDKQFKQFMSAADRKKIRKKQYKRKKKQKRKEEQQHAKRRLGQIIKQIYQAATNFQQSKIQIENIINQLIGDEKFHVFLNQTIKIHVKNMQKQIWDYMKTLIKQTSVQIYSQDQQFYLQMIEYIYQLFYQLKQSSCQVQKIINMFTCINSNSDHHIHDQYGLDKSTFKFMIDSDDTIKLNLLHACRRKISPKHITSVKHIRQLTQMIYKSDSDNYPEDEQQTEKSTSVDEEQQQKQKQKRRKRRRKLKDSDFSSSLEEVVRRLNQMVIMVQKRANCQVSEQWACSLKQRYEYP